MTLSVDTLHKLLRYEGTNMFWRYRPIEMFSGGRYSAERICESWNSRWATRETFKTVNQGYLNGMIFGKTYKAHRVIWAMETGAWPEGEIDHINHDRADNRLSNLRVVSSGDNQKNKKLPKNSASGHIGVYWHKVTKKWAAHISVNGKLTHLGLFCDIKDAIDVRDNASKKYGYHVNHGAAL